MKLTHPDLPAVLLKTGTVTKTKNYWFPGWSSVKSSPYIQSKTSPYISINQELASPKGKSRGPGKYHRA